ncbi:restriction endonuclease subunit S [Streptococcus sp. HCA-5024]|uniref:restriction endonuclease subunit S n=1 Tax=Streptococcus sp. HCA-5024 TaxID=3134665 RepID=UPI004040BD2E
MKAILPKIKFNNFYEKWNRKTLQSIAPLRGGLAFKSEKFQNVGIPIVRISNIGFDGTVGGEFEYYSKLSPDEKFVLKGRSLLLAMSGATTGKIAMLDSEEEYYQNQRVGYFQNNGTVDYDFLSSVLQTKAFTNQLNAVLVAGAQPNISSKEIDSFVFCIPESLDEQSTIGSLFRTLDDLLASYKDNLANYQSFKATMLSKMFPKAGQTVPEIRLDGFDGEWEIKRADEIFKSVSEKNRALLPVLSASQIDGMVLRDEIGIDIKYDEATLNNYKVVKPGQFVIHLRSFQGGFALSKLEGITSPAYTIIDFIDKENHLPGFWNSILTSKEFIKRLETVTYGIRDGKSISFKDFSSLKFVFPKLEEQQAIGSYFSNLDDLIVAHQEKISQLETLKKKLLQDMFI